MTIDQKPSIGPEEIRQALPSVIELFDQNWLKSQRCRRSADSALISPKSALFTRPQNLAAVRTGYAKPPMHPLAACIFAAERALKDYDAGNPSPVSPITMCRVLSLRDIASSAIPGLRQRLARLTNDDWKNALYEMLTAVSYSAVLHTELLDESGGTPTPDIKLATVPESFVECKAKLRFEQEIVDFKKQWRRRHLSQIHRALIPSDHSYIVRVRVHSIEAFFELPDGHVAESITQRDATTDAYTLEIESWPATSVKLTNPLPAMSESVWSHGWDFSEWDNWHHILPTGDIALADTDPRWATQYGQRVIICVLAEELRDNTLSVKAALKDACRRQLRNIKSGNIHLLLDQKFFGLGALRSLPAICSGLSGELRQLFKDYSRLSRVCVDVVDSGGAFGTDAPKVSRLDVCNPNAAQVNGYKSPLPVLLV